MTRPDRSTVLVEFTALLRSLSLDPGTELSADTMLSDIPGLDSFWLLQAMALLEEAFRVEIDVAALEDLTRVSDVLDAIASARPTDGIEDGG